MDSVVTVQVSAPVVVHVFPSGLEVAVYPVMGDPPSEPATQVNATDARPAVPATVVGGLGAPGGATGVMAAEGAEAALVPAELVALTVNVYAVPLVRPITVHVRPPVVEQCLLVSATDVAVYAVMAAPPSELGAVHDKLA